MQAILDRFSARGGSASGGEDTLATLRFNDGQELIVPTTELPKTAREGSALFLIFSASPSEEAHREKLAKSILNEILHTEE